MNSRKLFWMIHFSFFLSLSLSLSTYTNAGVVDWHMGWLDTST